MSVDTFHFLIVGEGWLLVGALWGIFFWMPNK